MTNLRKFLILFIPISVICFVSCATVPPEFITTMEAERNGISLLQKRHTQTVQELVENWYEERLARILYIKELELRKITIKLPNPAGGQPLEVIEKEALLKIEKQFDEAIALTNKTRLDLVAGYLDADNWDKLVKIHDINLDMAKSLLEIKKAQRKFYSELVGKTVPFPTDFISEKTKSVLKKIGIEEK